MAPSGLIAILAGWFVTEVGRQPWTVYGLLRTTEAVSNHDASQLSISLLLFVITYLLIFGAGIIYLIRIMAKGPKSSDPKDIDSHNRATLNAPAQ